MVNLIRDVGGDGRSAYQVAKDNGFTGTEAEWMSLLYRAPLIIAVLGDIAGGELVARADLPDAVWVDTARDVAGCDAPSTGTAVFTISVDEVTVGTVTFTAGQTAAAFAWVSTTFGPGVLRVRAPDPADATLRSVSMTVVLKTFAPG